jgi:hypothetical protein
MMLTSLQQIKIDVEDEGFATEWRDNGLLIKEQRRIVRWSMDTWIVYGVTREELFPEGQAKAEWWTSLVLGGPPFWTTHDQWAAEDLSSRLGIPIEPWGAAT